MSKIPAISPRSIGARAHLLLALLAAAGSLYAVRLDAFAQLGGSIGYWRPGALAGLGVQFPLSRAWNLRLSGNYTRDNYLFFPDYGVNGTLVLADVCVQSDRLAAALGTNVDYYFAAVSEKRIHGWHVELGVRAFHAGDKELSIVLGHINCIDPEFWKQVTHGDRLLPHEVLISNINKQYLLLRLGWTPRR